MSMHAIIADHFVRRNRPKMLRGRADGEEALSREPGSQTPVNTISNSFVSPKRVRKEEYTTTDQNTEQMPNEEKEGKKQVVVEEEGEEETEDVIIVDELDRYDIDPCLKESLREMDPESRREILNDIIRNNSASQMLASQPPSASFTGSRPSQAVDVDGINDDESESEESEEYTETETSENTYNSEMDGGHGMLLATIGQMFGIAGGNGNVNPMLMQHMQQMMLEMNQMHAQESLGIDGDIDAMDYDQLLQLQERVGHVSKGMTTEQVSTATVHVALSPSKRKGVNDKCVICLCEFESGDEEGLEIKKCKHTYHKDCIQEWFKENKTCPICKEEVL